MKTMRCWNVIAFDGYSYFIVRCNLIKKAAFEMWHSDDRLFVCRDDELSDYGID